MVATLDALIPAPARPCGTCGGRDTWRRERSGGWVCRTCAHLPKTLDDPGDPRVGRHECSRLCCGEDEAEDEPPAHVTYPARLSVRGPALLRCPGCRAWGRVLLVAEDGALACVGCAAG